LVAPAARVERLTSEVDDGINSIEHRRRERTGLRIPVMNFGDGKARWFVMRARHRGDRVSVVS
jgi:hypothetical protein